MQSRIDRKNEEINILKIGLSGIAKRYGYQNVQEFYRIYHKSHSAYVTYRQREAEWEKIYGTESHMSIQLFSQIMISFALAALQMHVCKNHHSLPNPPYIIFQPVIKNIVC